MQFAIVGAGIAGLSCADTLAERGHEIDLFDKGRVPGGRMSTRKIEVDGQTLNVDYGAPYFNARDPAFLDCVAAWEQNGIVARWPSAGNDAYVGAPGMSAPVSAMAARHRVAWKTRIEAIRRNGSKWQLTGTADDTRRYDAVIVSVPAEQAAPLMRPHAPGLADRAARTRSEPCWTAMAAFVDRIETDREIVRDAGAIGWATRDGAKPGRADTDTWVVHAAPAWSADHLEDAPDAVAEALFDQLENELGIRLPTPTYLAAHRWRYAHSGNSTGPSAFWDPEIALGACGDWLMGSDVEAGWLSGRRAGEAAAGGNLR